MWIFITLTSWTPLVLGAGEDTTSSLGREVEDPHEWTHFFTKYKEGDLDDDFDLTTLLVAAKGAQYNHFPSLSETSDLMEHWMTKYPNYLKREEKFDFKSYEGKPLKMYTLTDHTIPDKKSEVLLSSLIHAREGSTLLTVLHYVGNVLESAEKDDPEALYTLKKRKIYVLPIWNPDGYLANEELAKEDPSHAPMIRKNRRPVCEDDNTKDIGVDLNRNWAVQWEGGESCCSDPCGEEYRGTGPFSEPETEAVKTFLSRDDIDVKIADNIHSYGTTLCIPYNHRKKNNLDEDHQSIYNEMKDKMKYKKMGIAFDMVSYPVYGDSDDWMLRTLHIVALGPEVGPEAGGFWPDQSFRRGILERNLPRIKYVVYKAGCEIVPTRTQDRKSFVLRNAGLDDCPSFLFGTSHGGSHKVYTVDGGISKRQEVTVEIPAEDILSVNDEDIKMCTKEKGTPVCACGTKGADTKWHGKNDQDPLCSFLITHENTNGQDIISSYHTQANVHDVGTHERINPTVGTLLAATSDEATPERHAFLSGNY